jgi:hypothetical protein
MLLGCVYFSLDVADEFHDEALAGEENNAVG